MKQNTTSKLKFKKLRRALGDLLLYQAVGLLESLWQFTAADAPRGDIGKFTNEDIVTAVEWQGDPDELIEALVETGWLDKSDEFRLVVHHWHEHCPDYLRKRVQRRGESFVTESNRRLEPTNSPPSGTGGHRQTSAASGCLPRQAEPEPSQVKPSRDKPARRTLARPDVVPGDSSLPGVAVSDVQKKPCSDSGSSGEAARQIESLALCNAKGRIVEILRVQSPGLNPKGSKRHKQSLADLVTIDQVVEYCRNNRTALKAVEQHATEVAAGKMIKKPMAAWIQRLKGAGLFYKRAN